MSGKCGFTYEGRKRVGSDVRAAVDASAGRGAADVGQPLKVSYI
jgi:hypothetical protein